MKEQSSAARGAMILSIAGILSKVISIVYTPFLRAILGGEGYGIYCQVLDVFLFIYALATVGAQPAVAKVVAELNGLGYKDGAKKALKVSRKFYLLIGFLGCLLMIALAYPMSIAMGSGVLYGIIVLGPCILITSVLAAYRGYMQGNNNMKAIAISQVLEQFLNVILSLLCAFVFMSISTKAGVAGAQVGTSIGALAAVVYIMYHYGKEKHNEVEFEEENHHKVSPRKIRKKIILYSIPIVMSSGLQNLGGLIDAINVKSRLLVAGISKVDADILYGNYGFYKTLIGVPMVIITAIAVTVLPAISKARATGDRKEIKNKIRFGFKNSMAISIPAAVGLFLVRDYIYVFLNNSTEGAEIMKYGSFMLVLMAFTQIQTSVLQGINKFYYIIMTFGVGIIFKILLNYIFVAIPYLNIYGSLIGNAAWYIVPAILNHRMIKKTMKMKLSFIKLSFSPLLCSIIMAVVVWIIEIPINNILFRFVDLSRFVSIPILLVEVGLGGFTYIYSMILIGGIRRDDIESISSKVISIMPRFMRMKLK